LLRRVRDVLGANAGAIMPEAVAFQGDLDEIITATPPHFVRRIQYVVVMLIAALITVAALVQVEMVVVGSGTLITDEPSIVLQPMERSIIRSIGVRIGDTVKKGQILATLDPTFVKADMAALQGQQHSLQSQQNRLEAELKEAPYVPSNPSDPDEALQLTLFAQRSSEYASRLKAIDEEGRRLGNNIQSTTEDMGILGHQLTIAKDVEQMRATLLHSQTGSRLQYLDAQNVRMRTERDYLDSASRLMDLQHAMETKRAERQSFIDEWRRQLLEELVKVRDDNARVREGLTKAVRMHDLVEVTAPEDAIVLDIAKRSVGSVLREAEPLITLVPARAALIAEVKIASADVGYTKTGEDVVIKVDAFPYQRHGLLHGRLRSVSEQSFQAQTEEAAAQQKHPSNNAFHRGQIELTKLKLDNLPDGAHLIPGMTVTADIKVGSRSVLSYFIYPITRGFDEVIREP